MLDRVLVATEMLQWCHRDFRFRRKLLLLIESDSMVHTVLLLSSRCVFRGLVFYWLNFSGTDADGADCVRDRKSAACLAVPGLCATMMSRKFHNDGVSFLLGKTASDFYYPSILSLVWLIPRCKAKNDQLRNTMLANFCSRLKIQLCCIKQPGTKENGRVLNNIFVFFFHF